MDFDYLSIDLSKQKSHFGQGIYVLRLYISLNAAHS